MFSCVSITSLTTAAAYIAGLAIVALIATGWRKPARATAVSARATVRLLQRPPIQVTEEATTVHRPTPLWRKLWAIAAGSAIAVVTGALVAMGLAVGVAYTVVTLTDMLRQ